MDQAFERKLRAALSGVALPPLPATVTGEAAREASLHFGTIVSGDTFVNCGMTRQRLEREFAALAVEMEGAAVAHVAQRFGLPWVVVRCLSDLAAAIRIELPHSCPAAKAAAGGASRRDGIVNGS